MRSYYRVVEGNLGKYNLKSYWLTSVQCHYFLGENVLLVVTL